MMKERWAVPSYRKRVCKSIHRTWKEGWNQKASEAHGKLIKMALAQPAIKKRHSDGVKHSWIKRRKNTC